MAAPHAAGAAALLLAANPNLSASSLKATLMNNVDLLSQWDNVVKSGGRLNVAKAIQNQTVCTFSFIQTSQQFESNGGQRTISVNAPSNCDFTVFSQAVWITVTQGNPGSSNSVVNFTVMQNPNLSSRQGTIRIADQTLTITQKGLAGTVTPSNLSAVFDFDGDRRTDFSAIENINNIAVWRNLTASGSISAQAFGFFSDVPVAADYDGDRKWDIAVWRAGANVNDQAYFYVLNSATNTFQAIPWGTTGDNPRITQDFDGDGKADFAVTRKTNGVLSWFILQSFDNSFRAVQFGHENDIPIRGDFEGTGKANIAVYRPSNLNPANTFFVLKNSGGLMSARFGDSMTDTIIPGDFDGDRKTDFAVFRRTDGVWYWINSSNETFQAIKFGIGNIDLPVPGDYDGDGKTDIAVWRPNSFSNEPGIFYLNQSTSGFAAVAHGQSLMQIPAASQIGN
jgi:hypothetical protein